MAVLVDTTGFWDAYLMGDAAATARLAGGRFNAALDRDGTFEVRRADFKRKGRQIVVTVQGEQSL